MNNYRYRVLKVNGYKKTMVELELRKLYKKNNERKLKSKVRCKAWRYQSRN
jgi:hypothetical protein